MRWNGHNISRQKTENSDERSLKEFLRGVEFSQTVCRQPEAAVSKFEQKPYYLFNNTELEVEFLFLELLF